MNTTTLSARTRLLDAATSVIRAKGYEAATVDELCAAAGVTKGAFFHHFRSKEELARKAIDQWNSFTGSVFASAPYMQVEDPLQRLLAYVDFRIAIIDGRDLPEFTCLLGTIVQENYLTHPVLLSDCEAGISAHAAKVAELIEAARLQYLPDSDWTAESLALHTQAVIQGAFILAKAKNSAAIAKDSLMHLRRYIELLFAGPQTRQ
jgi:TetR/AcrR family transcriptional repressor of nem operon